MDCETAVRALRERNAEEKNSNETNFSEAITSEGESSTWGASSDSESSSNDYPLDFSDFERFYNPHVEALPLSPNENAPPALAAVAPSEPSCASKSWLSGV